MEKLFSSHYADIGYIFDTAMNKIHPQKDVI